MLVVKVVQVWSFARYWLPGTIASAVWTPVIFNTVSTAFSCEALQVRGPCLALQVSLHVC